MDFVPKNEILEFPEDVLAVVREEYDLDKPGRINEAVDVLDAWIRKQNHFTRKDFPRDYLERQIIFCKGSVERTKKRMDRNFTLKNFVPTLYETTNLKTDYKDSNILVDAVLPKLTEDYYRIYLLKNNGQRFINGTSGYFRFILMLAEYVVRHDYTKGIIVILDYTDTNILELLKALDFFELRAVTNLLIEGYGMRIKGIHVVCRSKAINTLMTIFKQILSAKLGERLQLHMNYESLHKVISKDNLPVELGGNGKSVIELHEQWIDVLSSEKNQAYFEEMKKAKTDENFRQSDTLNEEYMGMPGTFRTLNLD